MQLSKILEPYFKAMQLSAHFPRSQGSPSLNNHIVEGEEDIPSQSYCEGSEEFLSRMAGRTRNSGGHGEGETPVPIPNTVVKSLSGESTWRATVWEDSTPPELIVTLGPGLSIGAVAIPPPQ
jgi:hypothetical protein